GPGHPRTARLEGTLGRSLAAGGDLAGAREHLQRSLDVRAAALGPEHDEVASARYNLAMVMRRQGDHAAAIEQLRRGLRTRERSRGPDDAGHAEWLMRIGISELARGRSHQARAPLHRALELSERWGADRDRFSNIRVALARAYADEDPAKARVFAELARRAWADVPHERVQVDALLAELAKAEARASAPEVTPPAEPGPDR
ncbi:MAG: tetratricopeptide repeat protein, partial [Nannocystaceae bacterium]